MLYVEPVAAATAPLTPSTLTGVVRLVRVPSPNWPEEFSPNPRTVPS